MPGRKDKKRSEDETLQLAERELVKIGPRRVLLNKEGEAVSQERAWRLQGKFWDVAFIRRDGWNLGTTWDLVDVAESLWSEEWIGVLVKPSKHVMTIDEFRGAKDSLRVASDSGLQS